MTRLLSIFAAVLGMLVFGETAVEACLCGRGPCGAIATTPVLFEATIVSTEPDPGTGGGTRVLRLADVRAIRGPAPQVIELQGSSCDLELAVGQRYFIEAHEWAPGKFGVSQCSLTRPANRASGFHAFLRAGAAEPRPRLDLYTPPYNPFRRDFEHLSTGSDAAGRYEFSAVPPGRYEGGVGVPRPGEYRPFSPARALVAGRPEIRVEPGATVAVAPIVARRVEPVMVHGQLSSPDVPQSGAEIVVSTPDAGDTGGWRLATTDANGRFSAELYRGVRYRVWAVAGSQRTKAVEVVAGDELLLLIWPRPQ